jgi:putative nucleotidyltransferase with HDIG domain
MRKRILFVDDEPNVLYGLKRMLRSQRKHWDMAFTSGGEEALALMEQEPFEVVVSDMRMPGMDGAELLTAVMRRYPNAVRLILSGHSEWELIMKSVGPAHQYLTKPCDADQLKATVAQAFALRELLAEPNLQALVARLDTLPSLPAVYHKILETLRSPRASCMSVGQIVSEDPAMAAKVLQLVNSAFFGLGRNISNPCQAVTLLGLDTIRALVLSIHVFSELDQRQVKALSLDALWAHSLTVGTLAKRIAQAEVQDPKVWDDALLAGLLHDIGKLVLGTNLPDEYLAVRERAAEGEVSLPEAERQVFGASHAEIGAYLLGLWALPDPIVEAAAFHHRPSQYQSRRFSPLSAVHAADCLCTANSEEDTATPEQAFDLAYLDALGLPDRADAWRALYQPLREQAVTL